jgi:PKD repeat protein
VNTPPDPRVNIRQLFIAEPDFGRDANGNVIEKLVFTMQLAPSTDNSAPPSSQWYIVWNRQGSDPSDGDDSSFDRMWVGMKTDVTGTLSFEYGKFGVPLDPTNPDPFANTPISFGTADDGSYDVTSGVVTITISNSKFRAIDGGATEYIANSSLPDLNVRTYIARPDGGQRSQNNANDITGNGIYTLFGNASCIVNRPPVASLSASPTEGTAPLTVAFDGSASSDPDGSVVSYTFTFGDGSPAVTQSSPTIQHTYQNPADYFATLTVTDDAGADSSNIASVEIEVHAAPTSTCFEDDDTHLAYNPGWHTVSDADASAGHFRMSQGKGMSFSFQTQANTGTLQYFYATSTKDGSADLYLDGNFVRTLSYRGNSGSVHSPTFGASTEVALSGTGSHIFELRNASGSVYVDKLCVTEGSSSAQPWSGPGATTLSTDTLPLGESLPHPHSVPTTATALAVVAETTGALP